MNHDYRWVTIGADAHPFLWTVFSSLGARSLRVFVESSQAAEPIDRSRLGGLVLALAEYQGRTVAVAWSDFRIDAGSYTHTNTRRFSAFLRQLRLETDEGPPLLYVVSSAGVSLMQGRTLFSDAFGLVPELLAYAQERLVVTCALGKCLGLATLLFGLGHYRMAVAGRTHINLTGPEILKLFFGDGSDFARRASAEASVERNDLVHELVPSVGVAFERWKELLAPHPRPQAAAAEAPSATGALLGSFLDGPPQELVPGWCSSLGLFLGTRRGRPLGIFINPPRRPANLVTVRTLEKYAAGLDLFGAMRIPIVSFLDSPGVDPRFDQGDANNIRRMLWVGEKIIRYPHRSMGVIVGRCFGGASTLGIPKVFGGCRMVALRGSSIGVMHAGIIDQVLRQSPRLREQYRRSAAGQGPGFEDLLASGMLDAVIDPGQLPGEIDRLLDTPADRWEPAPCEPAPACEDQAGPAQARVLARNGAR